MAPPAPARVITSSPEKREDLAQPRIAQDASEPAAPKARTVSEADSNQREAQQRQAEHEAAQLEQLRQEALRAEQAARREAARVEAEQQEAARQDSLRQEQARQEQARQEQARLEQAKLEQARQEQAKLEQAKQEQAKLEQARQEQARLEQTKLEQAKLEQAKLEQAKLEQAKLEQAKLEQARQEQARQEPARQEEAKKELARRERAEQDAKREERLRAIGRQLDQESAERDRANRAPAAGVLRRGWLFGRADPNVELVQYAQAMGRKIELNMTYDIVRDAVKGRHVSPVVTVAVRADGSVEKVSFVTSSGVPALDEAVRKVIASQAPYGAFPPALARQYDVIEIRRTWIFDVAIRLE
ncbi:MAG: TonB family protein [Lysobacteraceae bacterium]|nr:MAG: TonB family protein [Xanthomonadaceae bacterium]